MQPSKHQTPEPHGDTWVGLSTEPLPMAEAIEFASQPNCGAVVTFSGIARDHSAGRSGVDLLEFEAYEQHVEPRLAALADFARKKWPDLVRIVILHRTGQLEVGDCAVVVVASSPHRPAAFAGARFCIDALKATVPIWKKERWEQGTSWGQDAQHLMDIEDLAEVHVNDDGSINLKESSK